MPYHAAKSDQCPASKPWACIKDSTGEVMGCHETKDAAEEQVAALYASEGDMMSELAAELAADAADRRARELGAVEPAVARAAPSGTARQVPFSGVQLRAELVDRGGRQFYHFHGFANTYEQPYEMWDSFGPYKEGIRQAAGTVSLAAKPDVVFLENHRGVTMARTTNGTLELNERDAGLYYDAYANPERQDVKDLASAVTDRLVTESSFAFWIDDGEWSPDYTEYWITRYNIHRGDVSAVNYGANPYTSVATRAREILADLDRLPIGAARAALARLSHRPDLAAITPPAAEPAPIPVETGRSITLVRGMLHLLKEQD